MRMPGGESGEYGGCEGPEAMYVKLISSDEHEFIIKREHALTSGTIKSMLSGPGKQNRFKDGSRTIKLPYASRAHKYMVMKLRGRCTELQEIFEYRFNPNI